MKISSHEKEQLEIRIQQQIDFEKLNELCEHLKDAIREIFDSCGLYYRIFSRVKSSESIAEKILRGQYGSEENPKRLQDLIGLRVALYYYDDLSICRDIMESTFQIIDSWSKTNFNANEFKATKINGVFKFPEEYFRLYTRELWELPIDTTFEIQFRTVFFEGWHEIEHDMRYKSFLSDDQFWQGSEELSRILNCILANLELCDWSLVQLFEQLSYNHYKNANWELMLKSRFRIKMDDSEHLDSRILAVFDRDKEIAKQFFKCSRKRLIRELLKLDNPHVTYNLIVAVLNEHTVKNSELATICEKINIAPSGERTFQRITLAPLESNVLFHLSLPLLHKEIRDIKSEFNNSSSIIYKWARYKLNSVFHDIPAETTSYLNNLPGYRLEIVFCPEELLFTMKMEHIDSRLPGTLWHVHASLHHQDGEQIEFTHTTSLSTPYGVAQRATFNKPSYLSDLSNKVGITDYVRLGSKARFIETPQDLDTFLELLEYPHRRLPIVVITQQSTPKSSAETDFREGYDMNTFPINGTRLAKVIGLYAHVYLLDRTLLPLWSEAQKLSAEDADGCIMIFWPPKSPKAPELFTKKMVCDTQFDFNRFAFYDQNINEKAFRHKLVQIIKDDNINKNPLH